MIYSSIVQVTALIDWNTQIHNANPPFKSPASVAAYTLTYVGGVLGRLLNRIGPSLRFDVSLRVYHGWYKGFEPSVNRRGFVTAANSIDFSSVSPRANVSIRPDIRFGDCLLAASDTRIHAKLGIHVPDTYRLNQRTRKFEEKMVDTAIASDLIFLAQSERNRWLVVLSSDDDILPALLTAEAFRGDGSGRLVLARERKGGPFFKLDGIQEWI